MVTEWQKISGKLYYFNKKGQMQTGWKKISGDWYYFENGKMKTGKLVYKGKTYKFGKDGVC